MSVKHNSRKRKRRGEVYLQSAKFADHVQDWYKPSDFKRLKELNWKLLYPGVKGQKIEQTASKWQKVVCEAIFFDINLIWLILDYIDLRVGSLYHPLLGKHLFKKKAPMYLSSLDNTHFHRLSHCTPPKPQLPTKSLNMIAASLAGINRDQKTGLPTLELTSFLKSGWESAFPKNLLLFFMSPSCSLDELPKPNTLKFLDFDTFSDPEYSSSYRSADTRPNHVTGFGSVDPLPLFQNCYRLPGKGLKYYCSYHKCCSNHQSIVTFPGTETWPLLWVIQGGGMYIRKRAPYNKWSNGSVSTNYPLQVMITSLATVRVFHPSGSTCLYGTFGTPEYVHIVVANYIPKNAK